MNVLDLLAFLVGGIGIFGSTLSLMRAIAEFTECKRGSRTGKVNGATLLSARAGMVKSALMLIALSIFTFRGFQSVLSPSLNFAPETVFALFSLTAITLYDEVFHRHLYSLVRPRSSDRRRVTD